MSRSFGVLDTGSHLAYNALFVIDSSGVVQASFSIKKPTTDDRETAESEVKILFLDQASHVSEADLPLDTAADVVELLRCVAMSIFGHFVADIAMDLLREAIADEDRV